MIDWLIDWLIIKLYRSAVYEKSEPHNLKNDFLGNFTKLNDVRNTISTVPETFLKQSSLI